MVKFSIASTVAVTLLVCETLFAVQTNIDCDNGDSLATAVSTASPGDNINVIGTCNEAITINTKNLTLNGNGTATISGASIIPPVDLVTIPSTDQVHIKGFNIEHGKIGIVANQGANFSLTDVNVSDSLTFGMDMSNSTVDIDNVTIMNSTVNGINAYFSSNIRISNGLTIHGSGTFGLNMQDGGVVKALDAQIDFSNNIFGSQITVGSTAIINDSTLIANNNQLVGIAIDSNSSVFLFSTSMTTNNNGLDGINTNTSSSFDVDASSVVTSNNNGRDGINLEDTNMNVFSFFLLPGPLIETNNNGRNGIFMILGAKLDVGINSGISSLGNAGAGILADDGSAITMKEANISGNGGVIVDDDGKKEGDVVLTFGSRLTLLENNVIGKTYCDKTSIIRGGKCKKIELD